MRILKIMLSAIALVFSSLAYGQPVEKPNLKLGDRWIFKTTDLFKNEELSRFEQRISAVSESVVNIDQTTTYSSKGANTGRVSKRTANPLTWTFQNSRIFEGKYVFLAFPLEVGQTWTNDYAFKKNDGSEVRFSSPVKVEGWEDIQVPAGKFRALKIVHSGFYSIRGTQQFWQGRAAETVWYVPEVKKFVRSDFIDTPGGDQVRTELVEFEIN